MTAAGQDTRAGDKGSGAPERRVLGLVGLQIAVAGTVVGFAARLPGFAHLHPLPWVLIAATQMAADRLSIRVSSDRNSQRFDLDSIPILVGAVLVIPGYLLLACFLGSLASEVIRRRPFVRQVFNVANQMLGVATALLVLHLGVGRAAPVSAHGWPFLVAAAGAYEGVTALCVVLVISCAEGVPGRDYFKSMAIEIVLVPAVSVPLAILAVDAYWTSSWAILMILGPAVVLGWWYRASQRVRSRLADTQALYAFSMALAEQTELTDVIAVALRETRRVVRCHYAEVCIDDDGSLTRYRLNGEDRLEEGVATPSAATALLQTKRAVLLPYGTKSEFLAVEGLNDAMAVPVPTGSDRSAVLVAGDREGTESNTFVRDDLDFLQALSAHIATALTSCEHLDRLRGAVAEREYQAFHDNLTGLANRTLFMEVVSAALQNSGGSRMVAVVLMDLDGFKEINDALGHQTGDAVLRIIASRVSTGLREIGLAARLGGDEFAFVVPAAVTVDEVMALSESIIESVGESMDVGGMSLSLRASVGIALAPVHGFDAASLLKKADVAMYSAKSSIRRVAVYDPKIDHHSHRRLALASDLGRAIEADQLQLWYQPVADISSGRITGFEALLRWPHPELGFVSPDEFIPIAEHTGLIEPLTWWVVREALAALRVWRNEGHEFAMAVNISARSLLDSTIVERLRTMTAAEDLSPENLTLEITESSMMLEFERSEGVLRELCDMGARIAIDDFGTGYSSLSRLKVLPVQVVKIDRSFIKNICFNLGDQAVVRSIIQLARVMGHTVVAEGVEDLPTWSRLAELGCDTAQGYYFAKPMTASDCRAWVNAKQPPSLAPVRQLGARRVEGA